MTEKERESGEARVSVEALLDLVGRHTRLFVVATAGCVLASLAWVATKPPVFRATATLILDDQGRAGGILGDLAALTKAPQAASEMEILRARTTAEQAVARPSGAPGAGLAGEAQRHLGLTTLVENPSLRPLASLFGGTDPFGGRLRAVLEGPEGESALDELRVEFLARGRVRISPVSFGSRLGFGVHEPLETELRPGRPIEYQGMSLTLSPEGEVTGRTFNVKRLGRSQAVERVLGNTSVHETERSSGVIRLSFSDSDPVRAAGTANALCQNYLDRNKARGEKRASQTVDFIDGQLDEQIEALHRAEKEVVELQQKSPRAVNIGKTGEALITQVSALEVQRVQAKLMQVSVRQALDLLEIGRVEALSRLTAELADPISTA
ncbi:MAG TPA: hypothetical protein VML54_04020, partial [Candidatus Limnocylindrales bacterium]|nr:hypothetical protein [Candidatus Limnocylindrales bacterium]